MNRVLTTFLLTAGFAIGAVAQEEAEESKLPAFETIDENEDGRIDQTEVEALLEVLENTDVEFEFETVDANEDGLIDGEEYAEYEEMLS